MSRTLRAHLALFAVNLLYAVNYPIAKSLMPGIIGPSGFILVRVIGAVLLFWSVRAFTPERVAPGDLLRLLLCGLFGVALNQLMFFHGLERTTALHASILMVVTPILVLLMSAVLLGERVTWMKLGGVLLGAGGAVMLISSKGGHAQDGATALGDLFILINASSFAVFLVMVKPLMGRYTAVTVMSWTFLFGSIMVLPFGWGEFRAVDWPALTVSVWGAIAFVVVMVTFVAYLLNAWALRVVDPSVVGTYIYLQPVMATAFSLVFARFGDRWFGLPHSTAPQVGLPVILSALAIFLGVHLVGRADAVKG